MAKTADLTIQILKQIRDEIALTRTDLATRIDATNARIDVTNARLGDTNARLDGTNEKVDLSSRRQTESELRLATEVVAVAHAVNGVRDLLRDRLDERDRIDDHERRLAALERRAPGH